MQAAFWTTVGLLCLTTGFGNAQKPQPCQAPSQYTGKMTMGIDYEINRLNKSCVKRQGPTDFQPLEVPKGAAFMSQVVLGTSSSPGQGVLVNNWREDIPHQSEALEFISHLQHYYDNVVGVDPDVFVPPPFCKDAKLEVNKDGKEANFFSFFNQN
ncbi:ependymin-1-like [Engraulis encrasicolus]|uniref:ependymin-1-like n=1 Tax=Engraulis encrasicolus TaxID=184585 RepID=UPI002FD39440